MAESNDVAGEGVWGQLQGALKNRLNTQAYATWVRQITCLTDEPKRLLLGLPDMFSLDWVNNHYRHVFEEELIKIAPDASLDLKLHEPTSPPAQAEATLPTMPAAPASDGWTAGPRSPSAAQPKATAPAQPPPIQINTAPMNDRYTFDAFVTGPSNQLAWAAARAVAENPGTAYNPLFVWGGVGLGKTHLVQSIAHLLQTRSADAKIHYQTTEQFVNDVIHGIRFERMESIRSVYRACDLLIIDDIQFISGKEACQAEFFHTFNALYDAKKQVVITSDKLPREIKDLEERVRSRFQWGLIVDLKPPDLETRIAILKKKAITDALNFDDQILSYIAQNVRSNVRELEGCLIRVGAYATLSKREPTLELAQEVLRDLFPSQGRLTCDGIVKHVCGYFEVKVIDIKSTKRGRAIAYPRQIAMYLCRKHTASSYPEIGNALGGKDHTTALNAFNKIKKRMAEPEVQRHVEEIERMFLK